MANTLELGNGKWATGKDTVLAFNDQNNNFKPLPFSFSRASSGTVVNKDGLIETVGSGEPRIDFKDNTKGALLLEPTRSNLLPYSEDFNVAVSVYSRDEAIKLGLIEKSRVGFYFGLIVVLVVVYFGYKKFKKRKKLKVEDDDF